MNWPLILMCSGFGIVMGAAATFGWLEGRETWIWVLVMLIVALVLGLRAPGKYFKHGFWTAIISTVLASIIQFAFWDTYVSNNTRLAESAEQMPEGWSIKTITMVGVPLIAALSGAIQGLITLLFGKLLGEKKSAAPPVQPVQ